MSLIEIGMVLPELALPPITRTTLALFAGASGDHNPMHIDIDAAKSGGMDDVFAHGMLSAAYLGRLLTGWVPQSQLRSLTMRFQSITPVAAQPTCRGEVTAVDVIDGEQRATIALQVTLHDGVTTLSGTASIAIAGA